MNGTQNQRGSLGYQDTQLVGSDSFPELTERGRAVVGNATTNHAELVQRVKSLMLWQWVFGITMFVALLIGIAGGINFNEAMLTNTREELTSADWWLRIGSALMMEATLVAVVAGIHVAFNPRIETGKRVLGFVLAIALFGGVLIIAASIGYSKFATLFDTLWSGSNTAAAASAPNFDPSAPANTTAVADIPFALRLASSAMFLGAGFLAALAEIAWLVVTNKLAATREKLVQYAEVLKRYASYLANREGHSKKQEEIATLLDPEYRYARAHTTVFQGVENYRNQAEANRPKPINAALVDRATWERHQIDSAKTDEFLKSADNVMANPEQLNDVINMFFPSPHRASAKTPAPHLISA